jgi:predicted ATPase
MYAFFRTEASFSFITENVDSGMLHENSQSVLTMGFFANLGLIFQVAPRKLMATKQKMSLEFVFDKKVFAWDLSVENDVEQLSMKTSDMIKKQTDSMFIPAKDMLTHAGGLMEMMSKYNIHDVPFDMTLLDVVRKAKQWKLGEVPAIAKSIVPQLEKVVNGELLVENEKFYVIKKDGRKVDFAVESEGIKKFGLIWQLLLNGNITKDTILLWDEPEANMNPKLTPYLVEILIALSRQGVQVFVATHNYFLSKYFEVLSSDEDNIAFHSLYFDEGNIKCEMGDRFSTLFRNDILSESVKLFEAEIQKACQ